MKNLQIFKYESNQFRTIKIDGKPWFVGKDVASLLGFKNTNDAINQHCKKSEIIQLSDIQVGSNTLPPHMRGATIKIIPESDMNRLIFKSTLKSAEKIQDWFYEEVIPNIRKNGFYGRPKKPLRAEFYERLGLNINNIPWNKFSVINETFTKIYSYAYSLGYEIPKIDEKTGKELMIDGSIGRTFSDELKITRPDLHEAREPYNHNFPDGRIVPANMYPMEAVQLLYEHIQYVWLPKHGIKYFTKRDPEALPYINEMIKLLK